MFAANSGAVSDEKLYIEDVFSTYLYTGNGSTQTINNGIDLAGEGGMVWITRRDTSGYNHLLFDTARNSGTSFTPLASNSTSNAPEGNIYPTFSEFTSSGYTVNTNWGGINTTNGEYASWTFRKAPKFFDVVTYTGNGATQTISHSLGQAPGMIVIKATSTTSNWVTYQQALGNTKYVNLNETGAAATWTYWNNTSPTSTQFTVNYSAGSGNNVNASGVTYVAYLFAHDTSANGLIQCGSYTGTGTSAAINLGWEPQYVLVKQTNTADDWFVFDNMRGMSVQTSGAAALFPNKSNAEIAGYTLPPTATGFMTGDFRTNGASYIYMAIRRGPMRTPTDGTKVFEPQVYTANNALSRTFTNSGGFVTDAVLTKNRSANDGVWMINRLVGNEVLRPWFTDAGNSTFSGLSFAVQNGYSNSTSSEVNYYWNDSTRSNVQYYFKRAPGFFDVVCYTGTGVGQVVNHNLGIKPQLIIVKRRDTAGTEWLVYAEPMMATQYAKLHLSDAFAANSTWQNTEPTSSVFTVSTNGAVGAAGGTYVAYLFASCPGVSKVGSYTGNGSSQTINCGFTNGARFFLVKATSTTGNWWVYDTARGVVAAADPTLALNTTAAEVTSADAVDPDSTGIIVNQEATCSINANGVSYIYLAIA